ncbi:MAG TPA: FTR1 family protein [Xanthobacteraceae bacterium]|jgi:high-affinity iron transporter|nr:FTR1 family protein [Xanthobacteraceae bacterium]
MLASLIIVFREVFEAGLIVGIILAATRGVPRRGIFIAGGVAAGVIGAALVAGFAGVLSDALAGRGQEVFNAVVLAVAVVMLGWHNLWMASHGRELAGEMKAMGRAVAGGDKSLIAMAIVVAIAVLREGAEVVLFLYGVAAGSTEGWLALLLGGVLGVALGAAVSMLLYVGLLAIPLHRLFSVTTWLIALVAAGMAGQAAAILAGIDVIPSFGFELWDTSWLLPQDSIIGRALHALVGYSDRPMGVQLAAYLVVLAVLAIGAHRIEATSAPAVPAGAAAPASKRAQHRERT